MRPFHVTCVTKTHMLYAASEDGQEPPCSEVCDEFVQVGFGIHYSNDVVALDMTPEAAEHYDLGTTYELTLSKPDVQ